MSILIGVSFVMTAEVRETENFGWEFSAENIRQTVKERALQYIGIKIDSRLQVGDSGKYGRKFINRYSWCGNEDTLASQIAS
ncbi:MAG TPA: hypothetical protein ENH82_12715 [bacterium]|nr:hypothetical protein [bacterium]